MDFKESTSTSPPKQTIIEWVLCSPIFNDTVLTAPERLNDTSINHNYQKISSKQITKESFNHAHYHCRTHGQKRQDSTSPSKYLMHNNIF